jgi:hypothetical protein
MLLFETLLIKKSDKGKGGNSTGKTLELGTCT